MEDTGIQPNYEQLLQLRVALIRDLRRHVPVPPAKEELDFPRHWDTDLDWKERIRGFSTKKSSHHSMIERWSKKA